uniref:Uncharacterized protein n=1 Tax=Oryza meridionalis TaxID=40149 RepID=A0A0E0C0X8_9ORYZ
MAPRAYGSARHGPRRVGPCLGCDCGTWAGTAWPGRCPGVDCSHYWIKAVNHRRASSTATAARRLIEQANTHLQCLRGSKFKHNGSRQADMHGQLHTLAVVEAECIIEAGNVVEGPM